MIVEKSRDRKQRYIRTKLEDSIMKATNKRNISILKINELIRNLEFRWANKTKILSKEI
jgi:transcriptional regulator NrdR family protein